MTIFIRWYSNCSVKWAQNLFYSTDQSLFESESEVTFGQVWLPILGICALQLTHPKCAHARAHTHTHTHTVNTLLEQWAAINDAAPREKLGFGALLKGTSVVVLSVERALNIHSPPHNSCRTWDSNSQPLGYKSNSLIIWPRLPLRKTCISEDVCV